MKTYLECYPCFLRQALGAVKMADGDAQQQHAVMAKSLALLQNLPPGATPPEIACRIHEAVRREIAEGDPYAVAKETSTRQAMALYERLQGLIRESEDPLATALRVSIAGNIIDLGVAEHYEDLWSTVERVKTQPYAIDDSRSLRSRLEEVDNVLFLADNAGETVFDRLLIEALPVSVVYVVKGGPVLNDATMEDALAAGPDAAATVVSNGSNAPGTLLPRCSNRFREQFADAQLIIAKGQAHYETLSDAGERIFCLLQVKCPVIARDIGAPVGSIVVRQSTGNLRNEDQSETNISRKAEEAQSL